MQRIFTVGVIATAVVAIATVGSANARLERAGAQDAHVGAQDVHVGARLTRGPWSAALKPSGALQVPGTAGPPTNAPVLSGDTLALVAGSSLYAYSRPAGGWSAATPGTYELPGNQLNDSSFSIAVGHGVIALSGFDPEHLPAQPGECYAPVFTAGPAGFSGAMTPAACLDLAPDSLAPVAAGTNTIVAFTQTELQVFAEPTGGWSGPVAPAAQLQASDGSSLGAVSMSGTTVAAAGPHAVYLFTEPAGGWSGVIHESARIPLAGAESLSLSGQTLTAVGGGTNGRAPVYVLHQPAAGWQAVGRPQPRAFVQAEVADANTIASLTPVSVADGTVAFSGILSLQHLLPHPSDFCQDGQECLTLWAMEGLSSTATAPRQLPVSAAENVNFIPLANGDVDGGDVTPIATEGSTLVLADTRLLPGNKWGTALFSIAHTRPARVTRATLTGLTGSQLKPALRLTVAAGTGSPALRSLRVLVPASLGGSGTPRTIKLRKPRRAATITLRQLRLTAVLRRTVGRIAAHGGRTTLTLPVQLIDTAGHSSQSQLTLTITR
jgi:hypothetical protein